MRYMLLSYDDEQAWERAGKAALEQAMDEAVGLTHELDARGQYLTAAPLHPSATTTSVRVRDGKKIVSDGPFTETHEQLGGFYLIEARDLNEAIAIAARHPGARMGTVQIRQVLELAGLPADRPARRANASTNRQEPHQQECKMQIEPQPEHTWLQKLVGTWSYEHECVMEPGQPPTKFAGTEVVRSIGGIWTVGEGQGAMPGGGPTTTLMTLGYDPQKKRFVGTFLGSMMTHLWIYEGSLDAGGKALTLDTEGPDMSSPGRMAKYQDVIEFKSDDHRTLTSRFEGVDGQWQEFMTAHYRRQK